MQPMRRRVGYRLLPVRWWFSVLLVWQMALAFNDLHESQYPEALSYLQAQGVVAGYPDGSFRPQLTVSRAELVALLLRGESAQQRDCFADVAPAAWYASAVCAAKAQGLVSGYTDGSFRPQQPVSYGEALKLLLGAFEIAAEPLAGPWYLPYQQVAQARGLLTVDYAPQAPISRDALAWLLYRLLTEAQQATYSAGCGTPPGAIGTAFEHGGRTRQMIVTLPPGYDPNRPYPLVVAFHGRTNSSVQVQRYFGLESELEAVIVYPSGLRQGAGYTWAGENGASDVALFDAIVARIKAHYCIDAARVFVVGHSLGAYFANSLACARGEVIRAVASVAGGISTTTCEGQVAALLLHHPEDALVPIHEGELARDTLLEHQGHIGEPQVVEGALLQAFNCLNYGNVEHPILWCAHSISNTPGGRRYTHLWPELTAQAVAQFFAALP
jgi:polyhydroxybutyrate depolymerase